METMIMNATGTATVEPVKKRKASIARKLMTAGMCANAMLATTALTTATAFADEANQDFKEINVSGVSADANSASSLMGKVLGVLLTITKYVGIALIIYGVYEIVMSFMQNQPDAKTKGIVMAIAGVIMVAMKTVILGSILGIS